MRPRFLADADLNHKIVTGLRRRESALDFLSAIDGGVVGIPDPEVLNIAADLGRILVTHDRKTMPGYFARFLVLIWVATDANEWVGHLGFVTI